MDYFYRTQFILVMLFLSSYSSAQDSIHFGFGYEKAPYVIGRTEKGLEIDIARAALATQHYKLTLEHFDNHNLTSALKMDRVQAIATVRDPERQFCEVKHFISFQEVAISLASEHLSINNISQLQGKPIVAYEGAWQALGNHYAALFKPNSPDRVQEHYFESRSQASQNAMFWAGRAKIIIEDKAIFSWYRHQLKDKYNTNRAIVVHNIFQESTPYSVFFKSPKLCAVFNKGLSVIKKEGQYQRLYEQYRYLPLSLDQASISTEQPSPVPID